MSLRTCFNRREAKMKCSGIDLHSNNSVVTVADEEDRVVAENPSSTCAVQSRRFSNGCESRPPEFDS